MLCSLLHRYIRLSFNDCMSATQMVVDLLASSWDLEPPRILLGVTGGAGAFDIPPKLDDMIKVGLEKAAQSESVWITTGGTNTGVMK
jgi:transient receptor potential cation channel subfamily M protein 4